MAHGAITCALDSVGLDHLTRNIRTSCEETIDGVLLSGGLDSSLVASIAQRETLRLQKEYARKQAFLNSGVRLRTHLICYRLCLRVESANEFDRSLG